MKITKAYTIEKDVAEDIDLLSEHDLKTSRGSSQFVNKILTEIRDSRIDELNKIKMKKQLEKRKTLNNKGGKRRK